MSEIKYVHGSIDCQNIGLDERYRNEICLYLKPAEISLLILTAKAVYKLFRPIMYYHPSIESFSSLTLFNRTLIKATYLGRYDSTWSAREFLDQTKYLDLTLDPTRDNTKINGQPLPAILISRILQSIEHRCPHIDISLTFAHCKCGATPISNFGEDNFPRVKKLTLCVGNHDPEETHPRKPARCLPNASFISSFLRWDNVSKLSKSRSASLLGESSS